MGRRGPKPKPSELKKLLGNPGKRPLNEHEPIPPDGEISPPSLLDAAAKPYWNQLAPVLMAMRVLTTADVFLVARYCNLLARYAELKEFLMLKGAAGTTYPIKDKNGKVRGFAEFPQSWEYRQLHQQLLSIERELGLTPSARSRMQVPPSAATPTSPPSTPKDAQLRDFFAGGGPAKPKPAKNA